MKFRSLLVFMGVAATIGVAAQTAEGDGMGCVEELELPQFAVASRVPEGGHVSAIVLLDNSGQPKIVNLDSTNPALSAEVEYYLRHKATYRKDCKQVSLQFTFKVEGPPVQCPFSKIRFRPPDHFVISTQPVQSTPDYIPVEPRKSKVKKKP